MNRNQMWGLYLTAKGSCSRPSAMMGITDRWAAYMLDSAVVLLGTIIENASQEQINVGGETAPRWERRYTLRQLLTPGFVIGNSDGDELPLGEIDGLLYDEVP